MSQGVLDSALLAALQTSTAFLERHAISSALVGGIAVSILIDFLLLDPAYTLSLLSRRGQTEFAGMHLSVCSPEDLIVLKVLAHRDKDMLDAKQVLQVYRDTLDREYVKHWANYFKCEDQLAKLQV